MKPIYWFCLLLVLILIGTICVGCSAPKPTVEDKPEEQPAPPDEPLCGGTTEYTDPDAPKTITDTEIASFKFYASMLSVLNDGSYPSLTEPRYEFSAVREGNVVTVTRNGETLQKDAVFMVKLQDVIAKHDFAQYNGDYHDTAGLPDDFGATIDVKYASGEKIYAMNNQFMFLPPEAVVDLVTLFYE